MWECTAFLCYDSEQYFFQVLNCWSDKRALGLELLNKIFSTDIFLAKWLTVYQENYNYRIHQPVQLQLHVACEFLNSSQKYVLWGHSNLDLWPLIIPWVQVNIFAKFQEITSPQHYWNVPLTRMRQTFRQTTWKRSASCHSCHCRGGRVE